MTILQTQEKTRLQHNLPELGEKQNISPLLQALILAISTIAGAIIGFSMGGLVVGTPIGALISLGGAVLAINIFKSCIHQPKDLLPESVGNDEALIDFTDPNPDETLVNFYDQVKTDLRVDQKPQFDGPIAFKAKKIRDWMKTSLEIRDCKVITLSNKGITKLPKEIGLFINLQFLDLSDNKLEALPVEILNLKSLTDLDLSGNNFKSLPSQICDLRSLKNLNIRKNHLQALPGAIGNLKFLEILWLFDNELKTLPPEIVQLESLKDLELVQNQFQAIPAEINQCISLEEFSIFDNPLQSPTPNRIGNLQYNGFSYLRQNA